jgi:hypothetical protein
LPGMIGEKAVRPKPGGGSDFFYVGCGVVVLGGSSGSVNDERARLFARHGAMAMALRWFGGEGQIPGICEVPLESFMPAGDSLAEAGCTRIAYVGTSKGAEAALLLAVHDPRIDIVIAFSPSSVVWADSGVGLDGVGIPLRSSWTFRGKSLPFVPYEVTSMPAPMTRSGRPSGLPWHWRKD